ncbi:MAG: hypothetical protein A3J48_02000 [Candidatus Doudnabacteria bacterium RIFCSPHIGHO2_02_FULL_46_11]|uniref:Cyclodeaminase/cyclohydrolase domain-containing protein n=1 Tax=Candidatus Doudnabacteria bacterium RIFCSPHIGHO2_02_FULL_46_11 TaxID=1817832 RepID=A0A1F5P5F9_9BACT|nr:MAG: hypothetical protein A3J48_02000 [Candidatus Doudnabacteria bacterium RIFCSPHIGHO2_02_FULL_46_11]
MSHSVWDQKLKDFLSSAASSEPTPGGGSVAGVVGALGMALLVMSLEIVVARADAKPEARDFLLQAKKKLENLQKFADEDIEAYRRLMKAFSGPKDAKQISNAAEASARVPLNAAKELVSGMALAQSAFNFVSGSIRADVLASIIFMKAALEVNLKNVDLNLPFIADESVKASLAHDAKVLMASI